MLRLGTHESILDSVYLYMDIQLNVYPALGLVIGLQFDCIPNLSKRICEYQGNGPSPLRLSVFQLQDVLRRHVDEQPPLQTHREVCRR